MERDTKNEGKRLPKRLIGQSCPACGWRFEDGQRYHRGDDGVERHVACPLSTVREMQGRSAQSMSVSGSAPLHFMQGTREMNSDTHEESSRTAQRRNRWSRELPPGMPLPESARLPAPGHVAQVAMPERPLAGLFEFVGFDAHTDLLTACLDGLGPRLSAEWPGNGYPPPQVHAPHLLIVGPHGSGRRTLARVYARDILVRAKTQAWPVLVDCPTVDEWTGLKPVGGPLRYRLVELSPQQLPTPARLCRYLCELQAYGVAIVRDLERLRPSVRTQLAEILQTGTWPGADEGAGFGRLTIVAWGQSPSHPHPEITEHFEVMVDLRHYEAADLAILARRQAGNFGIDLSDGVTEAIVERCNGLPMNITRLVRCIGDHVLLGIWPARMTSTAHVTEAATCLNLPRPQKDVSWKLVRGGGRATCIGGRQDAKTHGKRGDGGLPSPMEVVTEPAKVIPAA